MINMLKLEKDVENKEHLVVELMYILLTYCYQFQTCCLHHVETCLKTQSVNKSKLFIASNKIQTSNETIKHQTEADAVGTSKAEEAC